MGQYDVINLMKKFYNPIIWTFPVQIKLFLYK